MVENENFIEDRRNDCLRLIARERLERNQLVLPIISDSGDARDFRNLNATLNEEAIRSILQMVTSRKFNPETFNYIYGNLSQITRNQIGTIISRPTLTFEYFAPIMNVVIYADSGICDLHRTVSFLATLVTADYRPLMELYQPDFRVAARIDENVRIANENSASRALDYDRERFTVLIQEQTLFLRRGGYLLLAGCAIYLGVPCISALKILRRGTLENFPNTSSGSSSEADMISSVPTSIVAGSFWDLWSLFVRYISRKSD